jgi:hypothetical protein
MSKCERKVVRKFALETEKLMHSLYPTNKATKNKKTVELRGSLLSYEKNTIVVVHFAHASS